MNEIRNIYPHLFDGMIFDLLVRAQECVGWAGEGVFNNRLSRR